MARPFRFALQTSSAPDGKAWRERARMCEDRGFSTMYIPDHFTDQWGPLVALTVAAEATTTLTVGTLVFDNDYRHPVVLAKEAATLDLVSEGRFEFGLGAGWMKTDYDESGIPYDEPAVRVDRFEEGLQVIKSLWTDTKTTFKGQHYVITEAAGTPRPHTPGGPKIVIGGGGKRVLTLAAQYADVIGFNVNLKAGAVTPDAGKDGTEEKFLRRTQWVKEAAGDRFDQLDLQILTFLVQVVPNRDEVLTNMAPLFQLTPEQAGKVPMALVGTVEEICDQLEQRRELFGHNYIVIHEPEFDAFAPIVAKLAGT